MLFKDLDKNKINKTYKRHYYAYTQPWIPAPATGGTTHYVGTISDGDHFNEGQYGNRAGWHIADWRIQNNAVSDGNYDDQSFGTTHASDGWIFWKFPYKVKITGIVTQARNYTPGANYNVSDGRFYTDKSKSQQIGNMHKFGSAGECVVIKGIPEEGVLTNSIYWYKKGGEYSGMGELYLSAWLPEEVFLGDKKINVNLIHAPKIEGSLLSGFTSNNHYASIPPSINLNNANTWEMQFKIFYKTNTSDNQIIISEQCTKNASKLYVSKTGKLTMELSNNHSSYNIGTFSGSTVLTTEQWYWVKSKFTGTEYQIWLSLDGEIWNLEGTLSNTAKCSNNQYALGASGLWKYYYVFKGTIDLDGCSIKIDDETVWTGMREITSYDYYIDTPLQSISPLVSVPNSIKYYKSIWNGENYVISTATEEDYDFTKSYTAYKALKSYKKGQVLLWK